MVHPQCESYVHVAAADLIKEEILQVFTTLNLTTPIPITLKNFTTENSLKDLLLLRPFTKSISLRFFFSLFGMCLANDLDILQMNHKLPIYRNEFPMMR